MILSDDGSDPKKSSSEPAGTSGSRYAVAREMAEARILRWGLFGRGGLSDTEWDMLLMLYLAQERRDDVVAADLIGATEAPATTSLRWIRHLVEEQMILASPGGAALGMSTVQLSPTTRNLLDDYFGMIVRKRRV